MLKKLFLSVVLVVLLIGGVVFFIAMVNESGNSEMQSFRSEQYNLAFQYPTDYTLTEHVLNAAQRYHVQEVLIDKDWQEPKDGEGPPAIIFGVYQNNLDQFTAEQWIRNNSASNFKLSDEKLIPVELDGAKGFMYHWDGLYPAEEIVVAKGDNIYYIIVMYLNFTDDIIDDFKRILPTVDLD